MAYIGLHSLTENYVEIIQLSFFSLERFASVSQIHLNFGSYFSFGLLCYTPQGSSTITNQVVSQRKGHEKFRKIKTSKGKTFYVDQLLFIPH